MPIDRLEIMDKTIHSEVRNVPFQRPTDLVNADSQLKRTLFL